MNLSFIFIIILSLTFNTLLCIGVAECRWCSVGCDMVAYKLQYGVVPCGIVTVAWHGVVCCSAVWVVQCTVWWGTAVRGVAWHQSGTVCSGSVMWL